MSIITGRVSPLKIANDSKLSIVSSIIPLEIQLQQAITQLQECPNPVKEVASPPRMSNRKLKSTKNHDSKDYDNELLIYFLSDNITS